MCRSSRTPSGNSSNTSCTHVQNRRPVREIPAPLGGPGFSPAATWAREKGASAPEIIFVAASPPCPQTQKEGFLIAEFTRATARAPRNYGRKQFIPHPLKNRVLRIPEGLYCADLRPFGGV